MRLQCIVILLESRKHRIPSVQYGGGSFFLWGCFTTGGAGVFVKIDVIVNSAKCVDFDVRFCSPKPYMVLSIRQ
uniref:Uncharacterized protein n=1 Tax=Esox lucius TaxID=8010 RepID=A0AAY5L328_ESOLU